MLVITYLFGQAISNCGIWDRILLPLIMRIAKTPVRCILAVILSLYLAMYVVPQPMARLVLIAVVLAVFLVLFRKQVFGMKVELLPGTDSSFTGFQGREAAPVIVVAATVVLWMTNGLWGSGIQLFGYISANTLVTIVATAILFALGVLGKKDFAAIDVVTLLFLSAALIFLP